MKKYACLNLNTKDMMDLELLSKRYDGHDFNDETGLYYDPDPQDGIQKEAKDLHQSLIDRQDTDGLFYKLRRIDVHQLYTLGIACTVLADRMRIEREEKK